MKRIYYSIFFVHYKLILLGGYVKSWSAMSSSIAIALTLTFCVHFIVGCIFGRQFLVEHKSIRYGLMLFVSLVIFNLVLFIGKKRYLKIELDFTTSRKRYNTSIIIATLYFLLVFCIFFFIGFGYCNICC